MPVAAIILAAGASRRLGQPKQLLHVNGETLVARSARIAQEAGAAPIIIVLGAQEEAVRAALHCTGAIAIENPSWSNGLSTSVRAGVEALQVHAPQAEGVLLMNCDQPRLDSLYLAAVIAAFETKGGEAIIASSYAGVLGVPALFPHRYFDELKSLTGDIGARVLFKRHADSLIAIPFEGGDIDIDTPEDLAYLN